MNVDFLTVRQRFLIQYLQLHPGLHKQREILEAMRPYYVTDKDEDLSHEGSARRRLTADIAAIRNNGVAAVISTSRGIMLTTAEGFAHYHHGRITQMKRAIAREYQAIKEFGLADQIDMDGRIRAFIAEDE